MKIEDQVCSLELSQKLLTLGINENSYFYWSTDNNKEYFVDSEETYPIEAHYPRPKIVCAAFTSTEIFELLPNWINTGKDEPFNHFRFRLEKAHICKDDTIESLSSHFICNYYCDATECYGQNAWLQRKLSPHNFYSEKVADCLAKMLIYLLENKLLVINNE